MAKAREKLSISHWKWLLAACGWSGNLLDHCCLDLNHGSCDSLPETGQSDNPLQTWKLTIAYDGTGFSGWQVQPGEATIQGELRAALGRVTGERPLPQGSGRTDAGVHALGQVASFELAAAIPAGNLQRALNRTLPAAIRVVEARRVRSGFHARHSAVAKTYEYRVFQETICPPFMARYVHACAWPMDLKALQEAARQFVGEHDFLSFAATEPDLATRNGGGSEETDEVDGVAGANGAGKGSVRRVSSSEWGQVESGSGRILTYRVRGNGFLHHMVRNMVGTMLDAGRGRMAPGQICEILVARSRAAAGPTAPAQGLFLKSVEYPDGYELTDQA
jgi:tRNA pseudouridine38-40 synthase